MLTQEQVKKIKSQLIEQIESSFPEDKKEFAISQIEAMDAEQLESFLVKNNLLGKNGTTNSSGQCVFCSIVFGDIKSYKIDENAKAIAVLEINPVSRGHVIIIPKDHIAAQKELPKEVFVLSKKVSSLIKKKLKTEKVEISSSNILGHQIFNIVPFYSNQEISSERKPATAAELSELQEILTKKSAEKKPIAHEKKKDPKGTIKKSIKRSEKKLWLPKRIP